MRNRIMWKRRILLLIAAALLALGIVLGAVAENAGEAPEAAKETQYRVELADDAAGRCGILPRRLLYHPRCR